MIRVQQLKLPVGHTREELEQALFRELGIPGKNVRSWSIQKQSLDARKRPISYVYTLDAEVSGEEQVLKKRNRGKLSREEKKNLPVFPGRQCSSKTSAGDCRQRSGGAFLRSYAGQGRLPSHPFGAGRDGKAAERDGGTFLEDRGIGKRFQCPVRGGRCRNVLRRQAEYAGKGYHWKKQGGSASVRQVWRAGGNFI